MNTMRTLALAIMVPATLTGATLVMAQQNHVILRRNALVPGAVETSRESRMIGVSVVRLTNAAEAQYRHSHGGYATWKTLFKSGFVSAAQKRSGLAGMQLSPSAHVVPGWVLSLVTSANRQSYDLSLRNLTDPCSFSLFSDQRGVIYQGGVIDCSIDLRPPGIPLSPR